MVADEESEPSARTMCCCCCCSCQKPPWHKKIPPRELLRSGYSPRGGGKTAEKRLVLPIAVEGEVAYKRVMESAGGGGRKLPTHSAEYLRCRDYVQGRDRERPGSSVVLRQWVWAERGLEPRESTKVWAWAPSKEEIACRATSTLIPIAMGWREKKCMEKEAALFMNGKDWKGDWVMLWRTTVEVEMFDRSRGWGYICEDWTGHWIFVSQWSVKRVNLLEWKHNLHPGERVEFTKALGHESYWAAGVIQLADSPSHVESMDWEEAAPPRSYTPIIIIQSAPLRYSNSAD